MIPADDVTARASRLMLRVRAGDPVALESAMIREFEMAKDAVIEHDAQLAEKAGREVPSYAEAAKYLAHRLREQKSGDRPAGVG